MIYCCPTKWCSQPGHRAEITAVEKSETGKRWGLRLKATADAIFENKLHALPLTAARCLKERTHDALTKRSCDWQLQQLRASFVRPRKTTVCRIMLQIENLKCYIGFILVPESLGSFIFLNLVLNRWCVFVKRIPAEKN